MTEDVLTTYKIPPPDDVIFGLTIDSIQKSHTALCIFDSPLQHQISINESLWKVGIEWLVKKKWIPRQKVSGNRSAIKAVEPLGELLYRILEVCIQSHGFSPASAPYRNAAHWFQSVAFEMKRFDFNELTSKSERKGTGKKQYVKSVRDDIKALKERKNPNDPETDPASFALTEAGFAMADTSDRFDTDYWKPLIRAYSAWATELDKNSNWEYLHVTEQGVLIGQGGQGRGKIVLSRPVAK